MPYRTTRPQTAGTTRAHAPNTAHGSRCDSVPAGPAHHHVQALRAAGMSLQAIAAEAGVGPDTVGTLLTADPTTTFIRRRTESRVLDVALPGPPFIDEVAVERALCGQPVTLTATERLEAVSRLSAEGTTVRRTADLLGLSLRTVYRLRGQLRQQHDVA